MLQIKKLNQSIRELEIMIEGTRVRLKESYDRTLAIELKGLESHLDNLRSQLKMENIKREKEIIKLRLIRKSDQYSGIPLEYAGLLLSLFFKAVLETSKYLVFGVGIDKRRESNIIKTIDLRLEMIEYGSATYYLSSKISPTRIGKSLIQSVLENIFELLQFAPIGKSQKAYKMIGSDGAESFYEFFELIKENNLGVEIGWNTPGGESKIWIGDENKILGILETLQKIMNAIKFERIKMGDEKIHDRSLSLRLNVKEGFIRQKESKKLSGMLNISSVKEFDNKSKRTNVNSEIGTIQKTKTTKKHQK